MKRVPSTRTGDNTETVEKFIGTAYDKVRIVSDNIAAVVDVGNNIPMLQGISDNLDDILNGLGGGANDAELRNRATHTGTQAMSTITGLETALASKLGTGDSIPWTQVSGKPAFFSGAWIDLSGRPSTFPPSAHNHTIGEITGLTTSLAAKQDALGFTAENAANKGVPNGYAALDSSGLINPNNLPAIAITDRFVVGSQAAMLALNAQTGDVAIRTDLNRSFMLNGSPTVLGNWAELLSPTAGVSTVFGRAGAVTAQLGDYTTSIVAEGTNLYFTDVRVRATDLTGYAASGSRIALAAADTVLGAFNKIGRWLTDLAAVAFSGSASDLTTGTLPAARFNDTAHGNRAGGTLHADATTTVSGFMSGADKTKLNGIATGATANATDAALRDRASHTGTQPSTSISDFAEAVDDRVAGLLVAGANITISYNDVGNALTISATGGGGGGPTNLSYDAANRVVASDTGTDATLPLFTSSEAGLVPGSGGGTALFLRADGTWATPPGGGSGANLAYDIDTRLLSSDSGTDVVLPPDSGPRRFYAHHDCLSATSDGVFGPSNAGTGAAVAVQGSVPDSGIGWINLNLGSTATSRASFATAGTVIRFGFGRAYAASRLRLTALSNAVSTFSVRAGFIDSISAESQDGAFFRYTDTVNGGRFQAVTRQNNTETAADTGVAVAINTDYKLEVIVNADGTSAEFRINGVVVATITTNIPVGTSRDTGAGVMVLRTVGTATIVPVLLDYTNVEQIITAAR